MFIGVRYGFSLAGSVWIYHVYVHTYVVEDNLTLREHAFVPCTCNHTINSGYLYTHKQSTAATNIPMCMLTE